MRQDYLPLFQALKQALFRQGASVRKESELSAEFSLVTGWLLRFECERYYGPSFSIKVGPDENGPWYTVWILMKAFENLTGFDYGRPTIENQALFLERELDRLTSSPEFYGIEYGRLNEIEGPSA